MSIDLYQQNQVQQGFSPEQETLLKRKLNANEIYHRKGQNNKMLAYIKGSTAIAHANEIFGFGKWGYRILRQEVRKAYDLQDNVTGLFYETDVELFVLGAAFPFTGCGAASIEEPYKGVSYENARKSSVKDAVKLALVNYGDQFGLALYDGDAEVDLDGEAVKVSQVPVHEAGKAAPQKRIVEAGNAPKQLPRPQQPTELGSKLKAVKERALALGCKTKEEWEAMLNYLGIEKITGSAEIEIISSYLDKREQKAS